MSRKTRRKRRTSAPPRGRAQPGSPARKTAEAAATPAAAADTAAAAPAPQTDPAGTATTAAQEEAVGGARGRATPPSPGTSPTTPLSASEVGSQVASSAVAEDAPAAGADPVAGSPRPASAIAASSPSSLGEHSPGAAGPPAAPPPSTPSPSPRATPGGQDAARGDRAAPASEADRILESARALESTGVLDGPPAIGPLRPDDGDLDDRPAAADGADSEAPLDRGRDDDWRGQLPVPDLHAGEAPDDQAAVDAAAVAHDLGPPHSFAEDEVPSLADLAAHSLPAAASAPGDAAVSKPPDLDPPAGGAATTVHPVVTGDAAHPAVTGDAAHPVVTGDAAHHAVTGDAAHPVVTGGAAHPAVTGDAAHPVVTGDAAHPAVTGDAAHPAGHPAVVARPAEGPAPGAATSGPAPAAFDEPLTAPAAVAVAIVEPEASRAPRALTGLDEAAAPPHAFLKGAVVGLVALVPLTALAVHSIARFGVGDATASYYSVIAFVAVFAGLPAIVTVGGIGRAAAAAMVRPGKRGGRGGAIRVAVLLTAIAAIGLVVLGAVPLGAVPTDLHAWLWITAAGAVAGALGGALLGLWVRYGSRQP